MRTSTQPAWVISLVILGVFLLAWHLATGRPGLNPAGLTEEQIMGLEFKGDIVRTDGGGYKYNPEKSRGIPGPLAVLKKTRDELSEAFKKKGTNDHGIAYLVRYTVTRFAAGFISASVVAMFVGVLIGMSPLLYRALNPFIQVLKPISPLAWMPIALYTIKDSSVSGVFVIFICSSWPMLINTASGVGAVRRDWLAVAKTLEVRPLRKAFQVIMPAAA